MVLVKSSTSPATAGPAACQHAKPLVRLYLPVGAPGPFWRAKGVHATRKAGNVRNRLYVPKAARRNSRCGGLLLCRAGLSGIQKGGRHD